MSAGLDRKTFSRGLALSIALAAALGGAGAWAGAARADVKGKEAEKGPDSQGKGTEGPEGAAQQPKNPLPDIIELMKEVEKRLAETDTGAWTQEEQDRIVKALEFEGKSVEALRKLIEDIESQQGGGGGGGKGGNKPKPGDQNKDGQPQKPGKERQQDQGQQPVNPQGAEKDKDQRPNRSDQKKPQERNEQQSENDKKSDKAMPPAAAGAGLEPKRTVNVGERWGDLPAKQAREVIDAKRREIPQAWRKQIEDYFRKLAETKK